MLGSDTKSPVLDKEGRGARKWGVKSIWLLGEQSFHDTWNMLAFTSIRDLSKVYENVHWENLDLDFKGFLVPINIFLKRFFAVAVCFLRHREKEGEKENHLSVHSPSGHNSQCWAGPKPEARRSILVTHMGGTALGPSSADFSVHREPGQKRSSVTAL